MAGEWKVSLKWQYVDLGFPSVLLTLSRKKKIKILSPEQQHVSYLYVDSVNLFILFNSLSFFRRFSPAQAELYEAVLEIQRSCLSLCNPGVSLDHIYSTMLALLGQQLTRLGIIMAATSNANALKVQKEKKKLNKLLLGRFLVSLITRWVHPKQKNNWFPWTHANIPFCITENRWLYYFCSHLSALEGIKRFCCLNRFPVGINMHVNK